MKYCTNCGNELNDEAVICPKCGCLADSKPQPQATQETVKNNSTLSTVAFIFMVLGCVIYAATIIPLCWTIPMTVHYYKCTKNNLPVSTGFKICTILFVSLVGGILMLFENEQSN